VILAPFNSTKSHISDNFYLDESVQEILLPKDVLIFADKCKEINRQYMLNNNAELDNGVYNENEEKAKEEEQDGLMGMNQQLESHEPAIDAPMEPMPVSNLNSNIGSLNTSQIMVNEDNVEKMEKRFGFDPNYVISELNNDELNHTTTTYFLIDC